MRCSVVTIAFNNLAGLRATYDSVCAQSCTDFEWIVIDGGSTDGTAEFLDSEVKLDNFKYISEVDSGIYNAMNKGLFLAKGQYVTFLNSGDCFAGKNILREVFDSVGGALPTVIYGDAIEADARGRYYKVARSVKSNRYVMFTHHQAIFYRSDVAKENPYDETYKFGGDWAFTTKILRLKNSEFCRYDGAICVFERGGVSQSEHQRAQINKEHWRTYREVGQLPAIIAGPFWLLKTQTNKIRKLFPKLYDLVRYRKAGG